MKTLHRIALVMLVSAVPAALAQRGTLVFPPKPQPRPEVPRVWIDMDYQPPSWSASRVGNAYTGQVVVSDLKPVGGLVPGDQAREIIDRFRTAYPQMGSPRLLLFVNRELAVNPGELAAAHPQPLIADSQTARDLESLFSRTLIQGGASLVDRQAAAALVANRPFTEFIGTADTPEALADRQAIEKVADAVVEIFISSKTLAAPAAAGAQSRVLPDIQATAISLKDSHILGQAASADLINRVRPGAPTDYLVEDLTEATALALMADMSTAAK